MLAELSLYTGEGRLQCRGEVDWQATLGNFGLLPLEIRAIVYDIYFTDARMIPSRTREIICCCSSNAQVFSGGYMTPAFNSIALLRASRALREDSYAYFMRIWYSESKVLMEPWVVHLDYCGFPLPANLRPSRGRRDSRQNIELELWNAHVPKSAVDERILTCLSWVKSLKFDIDLTDFHTLTREGRGIGPIRDDSVTSIAHHLTALEILDIHLGDELAKKKKLAVTPMAYWR